MNLSDRSRPLIYLDKRKVSSFSDVLRIQANVILVSSLQMSQADVQALLLSVQNTEREARRDLSNASEEIASLQAKHLREIDDLERQVNRKDREKRNLEEELKERQDDLSRERETVRDLKVRLCAS